MAIRFPRCAALSHLMFAAFVCTACSAAAPTDDDALIPEDETTQATDYGMSGSVPEGSELRTTGNLNFRKGPSTGYGVIRVLPKGTIVVAAETQSPQNGYYKVEDKGKVGWCHGSYLKLVSTPDTVDGSGGSAGGGSGGSAGSTGGSSGGGGSAREDAIARLCAGFDTKPLYPPSKCDGPGGKTSRVQPSNKLYATSWFGCYRKSNGTVYKDPYDNCEFACGRMGYCPSSMSGPECEANLEWFSADADRFGCGTRIRALDCKTGRSVVLVALDRGPNCASVEQDCDAPVLDMSRPAMNYLFGGPLYGGCDHKRVVAEAVSDTTPLGPEL